MLPTNVRPSRKSKTCDRSAAAPAPVEGDGAPVAGRVSAPLAEEAANSDTTAVSRANWENMGRERIDHSRAGSSSPEIRHNQGKLRSSGVTGLANS